MGKERIENFSEELFLDLEYDDKLTCCDEIRGSQGFIFIKEWFKPYFYHNKDVPYLELRSYENSEKEYYIVSLWDSNTELLEFFCKNKKEYLKCINFFINMCKNLVDIEFKLKQLHEDEEN